MDIIKSLENGKLSIALKGRLDTTTAPELETLLERAIKVGEQNKEQDKEQDNVQELVFDFAELEYLSSAGIRVVMAAEKSMKGRMILTNLNEEIMEIFEMTGLTDLLHIE